MGRSEKSGRREQFFTDFKRIVVLFAPKYGEKWAVFPLFAADSVKSDRLLEQLATTGAVSASFYVGAVIGSIAVATGRTLSGGTSIADVLSFATRSNVNKPWLHTMLTRYPGVYDARIAHRSMYRLTASA
jgi:hypothetical protein